MIPHRILKNVEEVRLRSRPIFQRNIKNIRHRRKFSKKTLKIKVELYQQITSGQKNLKMP